MRKIVVLFLLVALIFISCKPELKTIEVTNLTLNKTSAVIEVGSSITLIATVLPEDASDKTITWTSSDETIATVENGVVSGLKEGQATITAISSDGATKVFCSVMVMEHPISVSIPKQFYIAPKGESLSITCEVVNGDSDVAYQWYRSGNGSIENATIIQDAESETLSLSPFENKGLYYYFCQVKNIYQDSEGNKHESTSVSSNVVTVAYTGLPTVYVNTPNGAPITSKEEWIGNATIEIKGSPNGEWNLEEMTTEIKGRGNSTWGQPKKPFALKLSKKKSIFEYPKHKRWVLLANYNDKSLLRYSLASYLSKKVFDNMDWAPSFESVDLVLNGEYVGNYIFGEQIKIDEKRVDISKESKGFIVEINGRLDEDYNFTTSHGVPISLKDFDDDSYKDKDGAIEFGESYAKPLIQHVEDVLFSDDYLDAIAGYESLVDVDSFIDWYLINELAKNRDAQGFSSIYMYFNPSNDKIFMGPIWDFDLGFGNDGETVCKDYTGLYIAYGTWWSRLMEDDAFKAKIKQRFKELELSIFKAVNIWVRQQADKIKTSAEVNFEKWDILGKYVWPNADGYEQRTTYESEVDYLINWINNRLDWLSNEFASW